MLGIDADDADDTTSSDYLALIADRLDTSSYLHTKNPPEEERVIIRLLQ